MKWVNIPMLPNENEENNLRQRKAAFNFKLIHLTKLIKTIQSNRFAGFYSKFISHPHLQTFEKTTSATWNCLKTLQKTVPCKPVIIKATLPSNFCFHNHRSSQILIQFPLLVK